jgi:UDP-galactopyranose mutase
MFIGDIFVFSHLRWNFVFQRPQHLISRLAQGRRIFFIEEPVRSDGAEHWKNYQVSGTTVSVFTPATPVEASGFSDEQMPYLKRLLANLIAQDPALRSAAAWFYTPMALPLAEAWNAPFVIYDCMDELSGFQGAPLELRNREAQLFDKADIVFTGGRSLYEAKRTRHPNIHCFPSSVDFVHYARARNPELDHPDQAGLRRPRLGFFGVIDERLDIALIRALAESHPEWEIAMVGPVVKIDPLSLPRMPNIHYFGQRAYDELPRFLAGWDVCLLPFALNDATRYISPTKTLEYMAGAKAIVSTPIRDVAEPYGGIVRIAATAQEFVRACEEALSESAEEKQHRATRMNEVLESTSWDATAAKMEALIEKAAAKRSVTTLAAPARDVIIGAGPTGLSAAYHLGEGSLLLEQNDSVGGWCRSLESNGFTFDYAGHIMFSNEPYVHELYRTLLGDNVHWQDREAWIFSKGVYTRYPFQGALYGLPPKVIKECIIGAIESRYGRLGKTRACATERNADCCADGIPELNTPLAEVGGDFGRPGSEPENFEQFIYRTWGSGIAKHFAIPYNQKLWAIPLSEMETSWLGGRVPLPDLEEMIEGALLPKPKPMGPNARFGYPLRGGFQALMDGFLPRLKGELRLNTAVVGISAKDKKLHLSTGESVRYQNLISTMPLPQLIRMLGPEVPLDVRRAAEALRYTSVCCVHIGVGRPDITDKHWIYYPEHTVFHRIFVQGNASPHCNPAGGFGFTCEITYGPGKPLPCDGEALIDLCIRDARSVGFIRDNDPIWATALVHLPCAYVIYDHQRSARVERIRQWLSTADIILAGRYGEWEYYNSDHAFIAGKRAAEHVAHGEMPPLTEQVAG